MGRELSPASGKTLGARDEGSEKIFHAVFDQAFQFMGLLLPDGTVMAANRTSLEFIRAEEADVLGKPFWTTPWWTHSAEQQKRLREAIRQAARGSFVRFETTHPAPDGTMHHIDFSLKPVIDENGRVFLLVPEGRDITDRRQADDKLRESEEKYRLLFSAESDAIIIFDAEGGRIMEANEAATSLYGYSREEFAGLEFSLITAEPERLPERIGEILAGRLGRIALVRHRKKDGSTFPAEISFGTFLWKDRRMIIEIIRDITESRKIAEMKDEMLSAVSHEMRTPLTAMLGFTEFMLENEIDAQRQREYLTIINKESERLKGLIDNLLSWQRLRAGFDGRNFGAVSVRGLFEEIVRFFEKSAQGHRFIIDIPSDLPPLLGDEGKLLQALENLVSNAVKFSPADTTITLGAHGDQDAITLWVRDEGPGIPQKAREQIFDRFFRIDNRDGRRIGGTGLGLPLVKEIVRLHEGRIWIEDAPGRGSIFFMRFPLDGVCWLH